MTSHHRSQAIANSSSSSKRFSDSGGFSTFALCAAARAAAAAVSLGAADLRAVCLLVRAAGLATAVLVACCRLVAGWRLAPPRASGRELAAGCEVSWCGRRLAVGPDDGGSTSTARSGCSEGGVGAGARAACVQGESVSAPVSVAGVPRAGGTVRGVVSHPVRVPSASSGGELRRSPLSFGFVPPPPAVPSVVATGEVSDGCAGMALCGAGGGSLACRRCCSSWLSAFSIAASRCLIFMNSPTFCFSESAAPVWSAVCCLVISPSLSRASASSSSSCFTRCSRRVAASVRVVHSSACFRRASAAPSRSRTRSSASVLARDSASALRSSRAARDSSCWRMATCRRSTSASRSVAAALSVATLASAALRF
mmetsp:Transcript_18728/g.48238  ORF Transcript_18728/g.48238 Transcript_18728/m.48238 type:complete len:368 (+) Transcript_18728:201-1304(+)